MYIDSLEPRRLFAAGDPLESFGYYGTAKFPAPLRAAYPSDLVVQNDGKILVGVLKQGLRPNELPITQADFVRVTSAGTPDVSFGGDGALDTFFDSVRAVATRKDGKFVAFGYVKDDAFTEGLGYR